MFSDNNMQYSSGNQNIPGFFSSASTADSSFCSDDSSNASSSWCDSTIMTPTSTPRRGSFGSLKFEDAILSASTSISTPERLGNSAGFCQMSSLTNDILSGFQDINMMYLVDKSTSDNDMPGINQFSSFVPTANESFHSLHGFPIANPIMDNDLYSPTSSDDFVVPSQTTFLDPFDLGDSSMATAKSTHFNISYNTQSPLSGCDSNFVETGSESPIGFYPNMPYPNTPSKASTWEPVRQPVCEPPQSSIALHKIQSYRHDSPYKPEPEVRRSRKAIKRELNTLDLHISRQQPAKKKCRYEGCTSKFVRPEHLKRHELKHDPNRPLYPCPFLPEYEKYACKKVFDRFDNLKQHVLLHADPNKKSPRTKHVPHAMEIYKNMSTKTRKNNKNEIKEEGGKARRTRSQEY